MNSPVKQLFPTPPNQFNVSLSSSTRHPLVKRQDEHTCTKDDNVVFTPRRQVRVRVTVQKPRHGCAWWWMLRQSNEPGLGISRHPEMEGAVDERVQQVAAYATASSASFHQSQKCIEIAAIPAIPAILATPKILWTGYLSSSTPIARLSASNKRGAPLTNPSTLLQTTQRMEGLDSRLRLSLRRLTKEGGRSKLSGAKILGCQRTMDTNAAAKPMQTNVTALNWYKRRNLQFCHREKPCSGVETLNIYELGPTCTRQGQNLPVAFRAGSMLGLVRKKKTYAALID